jgi:hypothetical protein
VGGEIRLQASGFIKDISINMLSDDDFSEVQLNFHVPQNSFLLWSEVLS